MSRGLFDLSGKIALVTGSSVGIGRMLAQGLADAGARVCIVSRQPVFEPLQTGIVAIDALTPDSVAASLSPIPDCFLFAFSRPANSANLALEVMPPPSSPVFAYQYISPLSYEQDSGLLDTRA